MACDEKKAVGSDVCLHERYGSKAHVTLGDSGTTPRRSAGAFVGVKAAP